MSVPPSCLAPAPPGAQLHKLQLRPERDPRGVTPRVTRPKKKHVSDGDGGRGRTLITQPDLRELLVREPLVPPCEN